MKRLWILFCIILTLFQAEAYRDDDDSISTTEKLIAWHGYSVEKHEVTTEDNYTLGVFRITGAPNKECLKKKAVILAHGLLCSSTDWIITGPDNALAYLLANHGYDVWLMNFRGNRYSRKHLNLTDQDEEFWNFSWHEMGVYDIPAVVDHVLKTEGRSQGVTFVCHSMGCTSLLVNLSERPEYNQKIDSVHMMAPISVINHTRSLINSIKGVIKTLEVGTFIFGQKEVSSKLIEGMWGEHCLKEKTYPMICSCPIFLLTGWYSDAEEHPSNLWEALYHQRGGLSSKTLTHFIQAADAGKLKKFDYGEQNNIYIYGLKDPPTYNMKNVSVPVIIYYSVNDVIADQRDVKKLASSLPMVTATRMISKKLNQHMDFLWKKSSRHSVYHKILAEMDSIAGKMTASPLTEYTVAPESLKTYQKISAVCQAQKGYPTEEMRETINALGYPMEYHVMTTDDGYVLTAHRIPPTNAAGHSPKKPYPVLLVHGVLMTSFSWLVMGPNKSLGYILADAGYDVWMINLRGNSNSKMHKTLPQCSNEFWDFSWHEMGIYDLPAAIDYILETTKMDKVDVVGYSMGGNVIAVMGAARPEYNSKVNVMHLMAPSVIITNDKLEPKLDLLAHLAVSEMLRLVIGDVLEIRSTIIAEALDISVCRFPLLYNLCSSLVYVFFGLHEDKYDETQLALYLTHVPDGTSTKTMVHLAQIALSGLFQQFDLQEKNVEVYGQSEPPSYNLTALTAKVRIYFSEIDEGVNVDGLHRFAKQLPHLIGMHERKHLRHQDYLFPMEKFSEPYRDIIRNMKSDRE